MNKRLLAIIAVTAFLAVELVGGASDASAQGLLGRTRARFGRQTVCCTTTTCTPTRVTLASRLRSRRANTACCPTTTVACEQPLAVQTAACCEPVACCQTAPAISCCDCCPVQRVSFRQRLRGRRQCCPTNACCAIECEGAGCGAASGESEGYSEDVIEAPSGVPSPPDKET